jgi:uncharacterized LabA/DUF88 family protein
MKDRDKAFPTYDAVRHELDLLSTGVMLTERYGSSQIAYWDAWLDDKGAESLVGLKITENSVQWYAKASEAFLSTVPQSARDKLRENFLPLKVTTQSTGTVVHQKGVDSRLIADMYRYALYLDVPVILLVSNDSDFAAPMQLLSDLGYMTLLISLAGVRTSKKLAGAVKQVLDYDVIRAAAAEVYEYNAKLHRGEVSPPG